MSHIVSGVAYFYVYGLQLHKTLMYAMRSGGIASELDEAQAMSKLNIVMETICISCFSTRVQTQVQMLQAEKEH